MKMEVRVQDVDMTSNSDGSMTVSGYVNKTNELSNVLGVTKRFVEKIGKGVFARAIQNSKRDIDFLAEHDSSKILASTRNESLSLREDDEGLFMEATITPTSWGRDAYTLIESGIYRNMSFGFKVVKDNWKSIENGLYERTINDLELFEVSVVKNPAYSQSTIAARGIDVVEDVELPMELQEEERAMEEIKELLKSLEQRVATLTNEITELRSSQEQAPEVTEPEVEEIEVVEDPTTEESTETEEQETEEDVEEVNEETETVEESEEQETEEVETQEEEETVEEETTEEVTEDEDQERAGTPFLDEFRNIIKSLKLED